MKPVQLLPSATVVQAAPSSPSGVIAIVLAGVVAIGVAGYFEWGKLSDVNALTAKATADTATATADASKLDQQILEAGSSKDDYSVTAETVSQDVITHLNERVKYASAARELRAVVPADVWLVSFNATNPDAGAGGGGGDAVQIEGYAHEMDSIAAFVTRLNSTGAYKGAHFTGATKTKDTKGKEWYDFKISADLAGGAGAAAGASGGTSQTVGNASGGVTEMALDPTPTYAREQAKLNKPKPKPKPLSNLEKVARAATNYGGGA